MQGEKIEREREREQMTAALRTRAASARGVWLGAALMLIGVLGGCGADESMDGNAQALGDAAGARYDYSASGDEAAMDQAAPEAPAEEGESPADPADGNEVTNLDASSGNLSPSRRIIKDAQLSIRVANVDLGISRLSGIAAQSGGYVLETGSDRQDQYYRTAIVKMAVPVDAFESALDQIRDAADEVLSEHASGVDVSQEYVDLQGQIANLEATEARIRGFLDQATSVEEALQVNARLTEIEGEISHRRGRLNYLAQRSAMSTIAVEISEPVPEIGPEPTATLAALPAWQPATVARDASRSLALVAQNIGNQLIWFVIFILPLALPLAFVAWVWRRWRARS